MGKHRSSAFSGSSQAEPLCGRLLVVDRDRLTRWSVKAYLSPMFEVLVAHSAVRALEILETHPVDAVVVSGDLPENGTDRVEVAARSGNPDAVVVRTVSEPVRGKSSDAAVIRLEKPFKLSALAAILGVPNL